MDTARGGSKEVYAATLSAVKCREKFALIDSCNRWVLQTPLRVFYNVNILTINGSVMYLKNKKIIAAYFFSLVFIFPGAAQADSVTKESGMTVTNLSSASNGGASFSLPEFPASDAPRYCLYNQYFLSLSAPGGRAVYATLLFAKATGKKIVRLDWSGGGTAAAPGECDVLLVVLQD
jgi:hypothetical protein